MAGIFPSVPKTAKVVPVLKKDSKLGYSYYRAIALLSIMKKYLKDLCIKDCIPFSIITILSTTCSLDSDNNILNLMP